ncbi:hypothetical protein GWK91_08035 [Virgibacillus sp. MSP4-1]|uniref:Spo0B domain-containing protein n=1 Tax=Virgibacillus sp. MSP4-1 TaxID=2700081 RepID=UPI00039EBDF3|nr:Spo0B domain-containing protein [Virgibacillus sp. MSP4-1]QHS22896.1 hypothetical protein GWK91_08035 [Virgibacillus sp. MSP4-1]
MKDEEIVDMIRHYRHDLLNHLQLIQGYAQMDKLDKVKEKTTELLDDLLLERKLSNLNGPTFTIWMMKFNSTYDSFRLSYEIDLDHADFSSIDRTLTNHCEEIIKELHKHILDEQIYNGKLSIYKQNDSVRMMIGFEGEFLNHQELKSSLVDKTFIQDVDMNEQGCSIRLRLM